MASAAEIFGQYGGQQGNNNGQGFIPQIVMNPWDPNQAPVMTLAPLANAMQAYHQQILMQQQQEQAAEEEDVEDKSKIVLCAPPDDEMGFLLNLPPPCNVILQPSSIGMSGKAPPESPFFIAFKKFLSGQSKNGKEKRALLAASCDLTYKRDSKSHFTSSLGVKSLRIRCNHANSN